ncbi:MAG: hypothetical protein CM15mP86_07070 [Gammaproteobacteria bacterium]|nr:MAG: hypothetical protein CM15mP86_07070 [Gammaproteobacteria bacterium]
MRKVINKIDSNEYDLIIDMQNNLKSAFLSFMCKSSVVGLDAKSVRNILHILLTKIKLEFLKICMQWKDKNSY